MESLQASDVFSHRLELSVRDKILFTLCAPLLIPFRILSALLLAFLIWSSSRLGLIFSNPEERDLRPHVGWRAMFQHCMWTVSGFLAFWLLGFRVNILGQQASREEARILVVAPHSSFMDVFTIALCYASPVARIENSKTWFLWAPQAIGHTIFVDRKSPESREAAKSDILERANSPLAWPQIFIFSEGTTTNGKYLARFRAGAFRPGLPVQPVLIKYGRADLCVWTKLQSHRFLHSLLLIFSNPFNEVTLQFLSVYQPSEQERSDPVLFAKNVQKLMGNHLDIPVTDFQRDELSLDLIKKQD